MRHFLSPLGLLAALAAVPVAASAQYGCVVNEACVTVTTLNTSPGSFSPESPSSIPPYPNTPDEVTYAMSNFYQFTFFNPSDNSGADFQIDGIGTWYGEQLYTYDPVAGYTFYNGTYDLAPLYDYQSAQTITISGGVDPNLSATPEPSSMVLLGTGIAGVAGMIRRRRRSA